VERAATVEARYWFAEGADVTFGDRVLLSLDCCVCCHCWRTIIFGNDEAEGKCTPTSHPFPGRIVAKEVRQTGPTASVLYRLEYRYEPFVDAKYPLRQPTGEPTWARVTFDLTCPPATRASSTASRQTPSDRGHVAAIAAAFSTSSTRNCR